MDDFIFDTSTLSCGLGFDSYNPFSTGLPTPTQLNEAFSNLDPTIDVSGFGLTEWKQYDPYNLDIRNPYVGGYPTLGGDWDLMLDYDPYAPHIYENLNSIMNAQRQYDELLSMSPAPTANLDTDIMSAGMFPDMISPEMANAMGLISDQDLAFLDMIGPRHDETLESHDVISEPSLEQQKLDKSDFIERERDTAVEKYNDAKSAGDYEEMLKWETIANDKQQDLFYLWDTPQYGLPAKAPGIA